MLPAEIWRLFVAICAVIIALQTATTEAGTSVWAAIGTTECRSPNVNGNNSSEGDGIQSVEFGCYATNSSSLRRLAGTRFFLAISEVGKLPESSCAEPPVKISFARCHRVKNSSSWASNSSTTFTWQLDASSLARCSASSAASSTNDGEAAACGQRGVARLGFACVRRRKRRSATWPTLTVDNGAECLGEGLARPEPFAVPCVHLRGCRPVWKAGEWGLCSRECGLGERARSVDCAQLTDTPQGPEYRPAPHQCRDSEARPHSREFCVLQPACPPYYRLRLGKCLPTFGGVAPLGGRLCNQTGLQSTNAQCVQLVGDAATGSNRTVALPSRNCRHRPAPFQRCRVDAEIMAKRDITCSEPADVEDELRAPRLSPAEPGSLLVQTERLPALDADCGQEVTLIPGTRLRLHCMVANYKAVDLRWRKVGRKRYFRHEEQKFSGRNRSKRKGKGKGKRRCGRICVHKGDLVFRRFKPKDAGTYEVSAGSAKASVKLNWHTAYQAFLDSYLPRAHLLTSGRRRPGVSDGSADGASAASSTKAELSLLRDAPSRGDQLAWMTGPWTDCPKLAAAACGDGEVVAEVFQRRRTVRCERLRTGAFAVVKGEQCERVLGTAPPTVENCTGSGGGGRRLLRRCPVWRVGDWEPGCPTSHCYLAGVSLNVRSLNCFDPNGDGNSSSSSSRILPHAECIRLAVSPKPETVRQCSNPDCKPEWASGAWSACSVSCGAFGLRSRRVSCVWRGTGLPAGMACEHLPMPKGYESCYGGPCYLLGCVDLSPVCKVYQASALCVHPSLRRSCCATCNTYQLQVYKNLRKS